jgi:hypothetical protein
MQRKTEREREILTKYFDMRHWNYLNVLKEIYTA